MLLNKQGNEKIDVVLLWVDGNDEQWIQQKREYLIEYGKYQGASSEIRFRDWDNLQFIFRGFEEFMPWINKVHFVTYGHLPNWLNINHPKLNIVNHQDFIPKKYLPTFNSHTIELNLHRIDGLSDQFIYFNDDIFIVAPTKKEDFFKNGSPKDIAALTPFVIKPNGIASIVVNNLEVINKYFTIDDIKANKNKWFNFRYGKYLLRTLLFSHWSSINGIYEPHTAMSFTKATYEDVWNKEYFLLDKTSFSKFREKDNVNSYLLRDYQLLKGNFSPRRYDFSKYFVINDDLDKIKKQLFSPGKTKLICLNDSDDISFFEETKKELKLCLEELLPKKSSFEI